MKHETCKRLGTRWNGSGEYLYYGYIIWKHSEMATPWKGHWEISTDTTHSHAVGATFPTMQDAKSWIANEQ
jgi:hypothetical protein